jgi:hypothetical protein
VTGFGTKKAALLSRYRAHPEYGNRSAAGRVAAELAPLAGLQAGTRRTYIAEELRKLTNLAAARSWPRRTMSSPQAEPSPQALGESLAALAAQVAALRGQVTLLSQRLDRAGIAGDLNLAARPRPGPRPGVPRPLAPRHHAPYRPHHPGMHTAVRHAPAFLVIGRLFSGRVVAPARRQLFATLIRLISPSTGSAIAVTGDS